MMVDGLGKEVLPQPYQPEASPTPRRTAPSALRLNASAASLSACHAGASAVRQRLQSNRCLWHAKAAKGTRGRVMGMNGARFGAVIGEEIGTRGMDRHAVGDGRSP